jgi:HK97 family phage major capsid protein
MEMETMLKSMKEAIEKFDGASETIKALNDKVEKMETKYLEMKAIGFGASDGKLLDNIWKTEKQAATFIDFMKCVWNKDREGVATFHTDDEKVKQMSEGTDSEGGYLVPDEFVPTLIRLIEVNGLVRQNATIIPMKGKTKVMPNLVSGVTVYWPDENQTITSSQPVFGQVQLDAKKMACLIPASSELVEDSTIAIATLLATLVAEAMALEEDRVCLVGITNNSDPFQGVLYNASVNAVVMGSGDTTFDKLDADDFLDLIDAISPSAQRNAKFTMHRTIFSLVRRLKEATTGHYIYEQPSGSTPGTIWGYPYLLSEVMPSNSLADSAQDNEAFILFGNLKYLYFGDRKRLTVAQSTHAGFAKDQIFFRYIQRIASLVAIPAAFAVLKTASS